MAGKQGIVTQGRSTAKAAENIQFEGHGEDLEDEYNALGWLNALPPQAGIPGWQRITFMKHFMDDFEQPEQDNLWAYEGVVLPGGRIILGRWWFASEPVNTHVSIPWTPGFCVLTTSRETTTDLSFSGLWMHPNSRMTGRSTTNKPPFVLRSAPDNPSRCYSAHSNNT
jgi:hypothetical protein